MATSNHSRPDAAKSGLLIFPNELLKLVCGDMSLEDISHLSLTCRDLYVKLLPILHRKDSKEDRQHIAASWACRHGQVTVLDRALTAGTDVNHRFPRLLRDGHTGTVHYRDLRQPPEAFPTLLHIATYYDQIDTLQFLISRGADRGAGGFPFQSRPGPESIFYARSPEAFNLLLPSVIQKGMPKIIIYMINEWASISTIETALAHSGNITTRSAAKLLERACENHRIDVFDLLVRHLRVGDDPKQDYYPHFMINAALMPKVLPMGESITEIIDRVASLPIENSLLANIDRPMVNFRTRNAPDENKTVSLLLLSMEPWVPISATQRILQLGADPHLRRHWPSSDLYIQEFNNGLGWPQGLFPILGTRWQMSGTALGYSLALTLMDRTSEYQRDNREKAQLLLEHGAGFETVGYPVSFMLMTITWPYSVNDIMDGIKSLGGEIMLRQTNRYGETHLSSVISWIAHGKNEGGEHGSTRPQERWADDIAGLVHNLLKTDQCDFYLNTPATDGPSKGLLPIEIAIRHQVPLVGPYRNPGLGEERRMFYQMGMLEVINVLLMHGARADTKDADGKSLLHWAATFAITERIHILLQYGAHVENVDDRGFTALHFACQTNVEDEDPMQGRHRVEIIRLLVENGADINAKTNDGRTPLFLACQTLATALIPELLALGAVMLEDDLGRSPRDAIQLAEAQYVDYDFGDFGALTSLLFELGDTDYVYDPQESALAVLDDPTCGVTFPPEEYAPLGRDPGSVWEFFNDEESTISKCEDAQYDNDLEDEEGEYGYEYFVEPWDGGEIRD
ncbi:ankyrin [Hypoxylon sp. FL0543]|nr:ankyrin [Hypoxylon sp. FL0543]